MSDSSSASLSALGCSITCRCVSASTMVSTTKAMRAGSRPPSSARYGDKYSVSLSAMILLVSRVEDHLDHGPGSGLLRALSRRGLHGWNANSECEYQFAYCRYDLNPFGALDERVDPRPNGRVAIVTGANSGIGYVTALELARSNAHVVMACRDRERGAAALARLQAEVPHGASSSARSIWRVSGRSKSSSNSGITTASICS